MRHGVVLEGPRFRLRSVNVDDAEFMLDLRHRDGIREHVNTTSRSIEDQRAWIERCLGSENDYSFVLDEIRSGARTGSFSVYELDEPRRRARIGRWLVRPGSRSVPEFALLGYAACFESLRLESVFCRIPDDNAAALAFQRRIGSTPLGATVRVELHGRMVTLLEFELPVAHWPSVREMLLPLAHGCHNWSERRGVGWRARATDAALVLLPMRCAAPRQAYENDEATNVHP